MEEDKKIEPLKTVPKRKIMSAITAICIMLLIMFVIVGVWVGILKIENREDEKGI